MASVRRLARSASRRDRKDWDGLEALEPRLLASATAAQIAASIDLADGIVPVYSGNALAVTTRTLLTSGGLLGFPTGGDGDFLMLGTGVADEIDTVANDGPPFLSSQGTDLGPVGEEGDTATISFTLPVPVSDDPLRLRFDFMFLSEEFDEFVGTEFNDFFAATINGVNIAKDSDGVEVGINNAFFTGESAEGTFFDGRTPLLTASYPVPNGVTSLEIELSIGDVGDGTIDSAVLLDHFRFESPQMVFLDFDGADVGAHFYPGTSMTIPAFSAADLGSAEETPAVIGQIVAGLQEKFTSYEIAFTTTAPTSGDFMTVVMGGSHDDLITISAMDNPLLFNQFSGSTAFKNILGPGVTLLGQAQSVDLGNVIRNDGAVVFTGEFNDIMELVVSTAHEIAHNLGLRHVSNANDDDIMSSGDVLPRSPEAVFNDRLMDLHEAWTDSTTQNDDQYLTSVLGRSNGAAGLEVGFDLNRRLRFFTGFLSSAVTLFDVTIGLATEDQEEGAQLLQLDTLGGPFQWSFIVPENAQLFFYGSSREGGPVDVFSGTPDGGNLDFEETFVPLFGIGGQVNPSLALAQGAAGNIVPFTTLNLVESGLGNFGFVNGEGPTFTDEDGDTYKVKLTGRGRVSVQLDDANGNGRGGIERMVVQGASSKSKLSVAVKKGVQGDGAVSIGDILGITLKSITARNSDLIGGGVVMSSFVGGVSVRDILHGADVVAPAALGKKTSLAARQVDNGTTIDVGLGTIKKFIAATFGDADPDSENFVNVPRILANDVKTMKIVGSTPLGLPGVFSGDLTLSRATGRSLGSMSVSHAIVDSMIRAAGSIGSVTTGVLKDSTIFAGIAGDQMGLPDALGDFVNVLASIGSVKVKGVADPLELEAFLPFDEQSFWFINSHVAAHRIKSIWVGHAKTNNSGTKFGLAMHGFSKATYIDPITGTHTTMDPVHFMEDFNSGDAEVRLF